MKIVLNPMQGAVIDGKELRLGMTYEEVCSAMGRPDSDEADRQYRKAYYAVSDSCISFEFNAKTDQLTYIEFSNGSDELQPELFGVSVFPMKADELFGLLKDRNNGGIIANDNGYSYVFKELGISIWRESIPEDIEEMIAEAEEDGEPMDEEDIAEEWKLANYWATVGVGGKEYIKAAESY